MNCIIPGLNVKVLARAIQALAKIGDELFIEAKDEKVKFLTFNQTKTVCGQFHLFYSFFSSLNINEDEACGSAISCKIHMKTLLPVFKGNHLEKKLEYIKMEYDSNGDFLIIKIKFKCDDIVITHTLKLMDPEILTIDNNLESGKNNICAESSFYNNLLTLFSSADDDITLEISKDKVVARNYYTGGPQKPKSVRSQVNLNGSEFSIFRIKEETTINFSLKPFRTAIQFAEGFNLNIGINFEKGGRPLSLIMKNPTFEVIFIVATLNPYSDGMSSIATTSLAARVTQVNVNGAHNITHEDLQAIANENWEDFENDSENVRKSPEPDKRKINGTKESAKKLENKRNTADLYGENFGQNTKIITKTHKKFTMDCNDEASDKRKRFSNAAEEREGVDVSKNDKSVNNIDKTDLDCIPKSPESPRTKKARFIFKRSYDPTYHADMLNEVLVPNSDSE